MGGYPTSIPCLQMERSKTLFRCSLTLPLLPGGESLYLEFLMPSQRATSYTSTIYRLRA